MLRERGSTANTDEKGNWKWKVLGEDWETLMGGRAAETQMLAPVIISASKAQKTQHSGWSDVLESSNSANLVMDTQLWQGFPGGSVVKNPCASARDVHSIPGSGRSPGGGNGNSLRYSCLENSIDRGAWWAIVLGVAQSQTPLNNWVTCTLLWWRRMCSLGTH